MADASSSFDGSENPLSESSVWVKTGGSTTGADLKKASGVVENAATDFDGASYGNTSRTWANDQESIVDMVYNNVSSANFRAFGATCRDDGSGNYYVARHSSISNNSNVVEIYSVSDGVDGSPIGSWTVNTTIRAIKLECIGDQIQAYTTPDDPAGTPTWTSRVGPLTNTDHSAGNAGVLGLGWAVAGGGGISYWEGSDLAGTTITGSGTPAAQAGTVAGSAERVLICTGTLLSSSASTAGEAALQFKLELTTALGRELRDENGAVVASLANIAYEWYDKDTDTTGSPDFSGTFSTNANGEATIQLAGTALASGQYGLLVLEHPTDNTIRGIYRIPVT